MTNKTDKTDRVIINDLKTGGEIHVKAYFIIISGRMLGKMYKIGGKRCFIGSSPNVDILIDDNSVSSQHAMAVLEGPDTVRITDLESKSGTFYKGERINSKTIRDNDKIQIGSLTILKLSFLDNIEAAFMQKLYEAANENA